MTNPKCPKDCTPCAIIAAASAELYIPRRDHSMLHRAVAEAGDDTKEYIYERMSQAVHYVREALARPGSVIEEVFRVAAQTFAQLEREIAAIANINGAASIHIDDEGIEKIRREFNRAIRNENEDWRQPIIFATQVRRGTAPLLIDWDRMLTAEDVAGSFPPLENPTATDDAQCICVAGRSRFCKAH